MPKERYKAEDKKFVVRNFSISPTDEKRLRELANFRQRSMSEVIRGAIDQSYREYVKERGGYFAGADSLNRRGKKEREQEQIDFVTNGDSIEVLNHLTEIGFLEPENTDDFRTKRYQFEGEGATRKLYEIHTDKNGKVTYRGVIYPSVEGLIRDMRKEKKL